jgi:preflagellin peptidase FlaK
MSHLGLLSIVLCSVFLLYACYSDLKTRSVPNELWLLLIAGGIPLNLYNIIVSDLHSLTYFIVTSVSNSWASRFSLFLQPKNILHLISFITNFPTLSFPISLGVPTSIVNLFVTGMPFFTYFIFSLFVTWIFTYLLFVLNLFGGADAKGLISIALILPRHPLNAYPIFDPFPFAITTLFNGAIASAVILPFVFLIMFVYNLVYLRPEEVKKNLGLVLIGYKTRIDTLAKVNYRLLRLLHSFEEEGGGTLKRKFVVGGLEIDEERIEQLTRYHEEGKIGEYVWVTPGLPYMLFITTGFFIALFYGNLIFELIGLFLSL